MLNFADFSVENEFAAEIWEIYDSASWNPWFSGFLFYENFISCNVFITMQKGTFIRINSLILKNISLLFIAGNFGCFMRKIGL